MSNIQFKRKKFQAIKNMQDPRCNMQWKHKDNFLGSISNIQFNHKKFQIPNSKFQTRTICKMQYAICNKIARNFKSQIPNFKRSAKEKNNFSVIPGKTWAKRIFFIGYLINNNMQGSICNIQLKVQEIVNTNNMQDAICNGSIKIISKDQYPISNLITRNLKSRIPNSKRSAGWN